MQGEHLHTIVSQPSLRIAELNSNRLSGTLAPAAAALRASSAPPSLLAVLALRDNDISGSLPAAFARLGVWQAPSPLDLGSFLDLRDNRLRGEVPQNWLETHSGGLVNVRRLLTTLRCAPERLSAGGLQCLAQHSAR